MDKKEIENTHKSANHMTYKSYGLRVKTRVFHRSTEIAMFKEMSRFHHISFLKVVSTVSCLGRHSNNTYHVSQVNLRAPLLRDRKNREWGAEVTFGTSPSSQDRESRSLEHFGAGRTLHKAFFQYSLKGLL